MPERWYLPVYHAGPMPAAMIDRISTYVRQRGLGEIIPRICQQKHQPRYYLCLAIVSDSPGEIPPEVYRLIQQLNIGHPLDGALSYDEVANSRFFSGEIETTSFSRQIKAQALVKRPIDNPLDFSEQENISGSAENYNKLLYWLSATGTGTWQLFRNACEVLGLAKNNAQTRHLFRQFRSLGHIEYLDNGAKWVICPTCLVQKADDPCTYFIAGQITLAMLAAIQQHVFVKSRSQSDRGAPDLFQLSFADSSEVAQILEHLKQSNEYQVFNVGEAGPKLAHILPDLEGWQALLRPFNIDSDVYRIHRWDGHDFNEWIDTPVEIGMYRFSRNSAGDELNYFVFYDPERDEYLQGDWYGLRYLANYFLKIQPHVYYYQPDQRLLLPHEYRLPDLYERALVLCSGQLPIRGSSGVIFENIPLKMLDILAQKLQFDIRNWIKDE